MDEQPRDRNPRFVILDGVRTEQRRQAATDRLRYRNEAGADGDVSPGPQKRTALTRQIEALEVIAGICEVQTRAARAGSAAGSLERWNRITGQIETELTALRSQRELADRRSKDRANR
jgi:hypothetical protein